MAPIKTTTKAKARHQKNGRATTTATADAAGRRRATANADMILAMNDPYMQQIIDGTKNYEFRKYNMAGIERIWFYRTAPHSAITHVCEVSPAATRNPGDQPIPENGLGNKEYNERSPDWDGYDYAYRINSVYQINTSDGKGIKWPQMRDEHGMKIAPRGRVRLPATIAEQHPWAQQTKIL